MEAADVAGRALERGSDVGVEPRERLVPSRRGHLERVETRAVEALDHVAQRIVPASAYVVDQPRHRCGQPRVVPGLPVEQQLHRPLVEIAERPTREELDGRHGISLSILVTRSPSAPSAFSREIVW